MDDYGRITKQNEHNALIIMAAIVGGISLLIVLGFIIFVVAATIMPNNPSSKVGQTESQTESQAESRPQSNTRPSIPNGFGSFPNQGVPVIP
jgi:hypothetical protein